MHIELTEIELLQAFSDPEKSLPVEQGEYDLVVNQKFAGKCTIHETNALLFQQILLPENRPAYLRKDLAQERNDIAIYFSSSNEYLEEELQREEKRSKQKQKERKLFVLSMDQHVNEEEDRHTRAQHHIKKIGEAANVEVWIASNDHHRHYDGESLGEDASELPAYPITKEIQKRNELIDTIWFDKNEIICAFEVETTTSIYSGLLRLCDLYLSIPMRVPKFYIVAPMEREEKVMREARRPTFIHTGFSEHVKFVPLEMLAPLLQKIEGLEGCLTTDIIDKIAISCH
jgi:hypothetical protein